MSALKMITVADYFATNRESDTKLEYYHGQIFAMAGASPAHNAIAVNLMSRLHTALQTRPCQVYNSDQQVTSLTGGYFYPDVSVACEPRFEGERNEILVNPVLLVEVLSDSTEARDRGLKFLQYRSIPSLKEVLFVAQDRRCVERYTRRSGDWVLTTFGPEDHSVELTSLQLSLQLDEVYLKVTFDSPTRL